MVIVSAVIPTRGRPELLRRAVRSALAQTLREIEVVIVIDGENSPPTFRWKSWTQQDGRVRRITLSSRLVDRTPETGGSDAAQANGSRFWMTMTNGFRGNSRPRSRR